MTESNLKARPERAHAASPRNFLRQLDLGTLELFTLICECGSIARAAQRGQIAASALSKRVADLEALARTPLLLRHARGVLPTPAGEQLLRNAQQLLLAAEQLRVDLDEYAQGVRGRVTVCASASVVEQFLPRDLADFMRSQADIRIELHQAASRAVAQAVREGEADIGICGDSDAVLGLQARPYRQEQLVLVVPRGHALARLRRVAFERALDYPQIGLRDSSTVQTLLTREASATRRVLRHCIEVDSLSAMCRMVENGLGIGVMPQGAFKALGEATSLKAIELSDGWARRRLNLYARDFAALPVAAQRLADHLAPPP